MPDSHDLTRATRRDIPRLAELWCHAFPGEKTLEQRIRQLEAGGTYGGIEDAWYLTRQERVAAALRLYSLTEYLHGTRFPMLGVAAVAVAPEARRQGLASELCRLGLRLGRDRGDVVSVLYPFRPDFYRRLGWGLAGALHCFRFRPQTLPAPGTATRVRLGDAALRPAVAACYQRVAERSHGLIERNERIWEQHLGGPERYLYVLPGSGGVAGYLLVKYGKQRRPAERTLTIRELVAESPEAYRELLGWIALQADQWPLVRYDALPEEQIDLLLSDPRLPGFRPARTLWAPAARRICGPMLRVLNVPAALEGRRTWSGRTSCTFTLRVLDPELPENEGPWLVTCAHGTVSCRPGAAAVRIDLELGAAAFAQLFVGELSAGVAVGLGLARSDAPEQLAVVDALFRCDRTYRLLDEF
ncbi:MAG: GNAT family N-acetyltransferase [Gemmatimonadetes bacterium]|nr:GNAT family N-acetyltransferase [Gemmatimonadota bacterium]